jgi:hypothetical protein
VFRAQQRWVSQWFALGRSPLPVRSLAEPPLLTRFRLETRSLPGLARKGRPPLRAGRPFLDIPVKTGVSPGREREWGL